MVASLGGPSPYSPAQGPCGAPHCLPFTRKCFSVARPAWSSGLSLGSGTCLPPTCRRPGPPAWRGASACVSAATTHVLLPGPTPTRTSPRLQCTLHGLPSPALSSGLHQGRSPPQPRGSDCPFWALGMTFWLASGPAGGLNQQRGGCGSASGDPAGRPKLPPRHKALWARSSLPGRTCGTLRGLGWEARPRYSPPPAGRTW